MIAKKHSKFRNYAALRQGWLCYYCDLPMWGKGSLYAGEKLVSVPEFAATAEHLIAQQDGGRDSQSNIVAAHRVCNQRRHHPKRALPASEYKTYVKTKFDKLRWFGTEERKLLADSLSEHLNAKATAHPIPPFGLAKITHIEQGFQLALL